MVCTCRWLQSSPGSVTWIRRGTHGCMDGAQLGARPWGSILGSTQDASMPCITRKSTGTLRGVGNVMHLPVVVLRRHGRMDRVEATRYGPDSSSSSYSYEVRVRVLFLLRMDPMHSPSIPDAMRATPSRTVCHHLSRPAPCRRASDEPCRRIQAVL